MLYVSGAKTLTHTLETYSSTGLLEMASESYILYLEDEVTAAGHVLEDLMKERNDPLVADAFKGVENR